MAQGVLGLSSGYMVSVACRFAGLTPSPVHLAQLNRSITLLSHERGMVRPAFSGCCEDLK